MVLRNLLKTSSLALAPLVMISCSAELVNKVPAATNISPKQTAVQTPAATKPETSSPLQNSEEQSQQLASLFGQSVREFQNKTGHRILSRAEVRKSFPGKLFLANVMYVNVDENKYAGTFNHALKRGGFLKSNSLCHGRGTPGVPQELSLALVIPQMISLESGGESPELLDGMPSSYELSISGDSVHCVHKPNIRGVQDILGSLMTPTHYTTSDDRNYEGWVTYNRDTETLIFFSEGPNDVSVDLHYMVINKKNEFRAVSLTYQKDKSGDPSTVVKKKKKKKLAPVAAAAAKNS